MTTLLFSEKPALRAVFGFAASAARGTISETQFSSSAARLFKAGAAPGFLVHGGRARPVGDASLPIGILGGVNGQSRVVHLAAGDYAVLVSDGLLVDGTGWGAQAAGTLRCRCRPPEQLAKTLVETARTRAETTGRPDDITAAVLRLESCGR